MSPSEPRSGDEGWREATSVVQGKPTAEARQRQRKSRNRRVALLVAVAVFPLAVLGILLGTGGGMPDLDRSDPPLVVLIAGLVLMGIGMVLGIIAMVRIRRAGMWGQAWRDPLLSLGRMERRHLLRRIRRVEPVTDQQYVVATDLARRVARQGPLVLLYGGLCFMAAGQALYSSSPLLRGMHAIGLVAWSVVLFLMRRDMGRAGRWLEQYAPDGPST